MDSEQGWHLSFLASRGKRVVGGRENRRGQLCLGLDLQEGLGHSRINPPPPPPRRRRCSWGNFQKAQSSLGFCHLQLLPAKEEVAEFQLEHQSSALEVTSPWCDWSFSPCTADSVSLGQRFSWRKVSSLTLKNSLSLKLAVCRTDAQCLSWISPGHRGQRSHLVFKKSF